MKSQGRIAGVVFLIALFILPIDLFASQLKGKIQSISNKAKSIQLLVNDTKKVEVVRFSEKTTYVNANSIKEFIKNDVIIVDGKPGEVAKKIKRVLITLPNHKVITTQGLAKIINQPKIPYTLVDARPEGRYQAGHLPGSLSIPVKALSKSWKLLPSNKEQLLVFYCGGPT